MIEIEFRGTIKNQTELFSGFWYGDLIHYANGDVAIRQIETGQEFEVYPETVGQFTGLLDKNGKKIFEGDVLKWRCSKSGSNKDKNYTVTIEFKEKAHSYSLTIYDNGEKWATQNSYWNQSEREIIGNITENPELLK